MPKAGILSIGTHVPFSLAEENTLTLGYKAAEKVLQQAQMQPDQVEALFLGTETPLYEVKPTSVMMASYLGLPNHARAADVEFACKAGAVAIDIVAQMIQSGAIDLGLAIAADTPEAEASDPLHQYLNAGAAAVLLGNSEKYKTLAMLEAVTSVNEDRHDFWRSEGEQFPTHTGLWSAHCYQTLITQVTEALFQKTGLKAKEIDHVAIHMPTAELPIKTLKSLGFKPDQWKAGYIFEKTGNAFTATCLLALAEVLKVAQPRQNILLLSYGSGAGAQAMLWKTSQK